MKPVCVYTVTYNRASLLPRAIKSVLSQTFTDFEYVIVDNGSTDETLSVCDSYAKADPRIKVSHLKKNSVAKGFNIAMRWARSIADYFIQFDDDDYAEPDMLEFLYKNAISSNADISMCGSYTVYQDGRMEPYFIYDEQYKLNKLEGLEQLLKRRLYNTAPPTKLFKSTVFNYSSLTKNNKKVTIGDIHSIYKLFAEANTIVTQGIPKYYFYKHGQNVTSYIQTNVLTDKLLKEYLWAFKNRTRYLTKTVPEARNLARYSEWSYMLSMCNKIKSMNVGGCEEQYQRMILNLKKNQDEFLLSHYITPEEKSLLKSFIE